MEKRTKNTAVRITSTWGDNAGFRFGYVKPDVLAAGVVTAILIYEERSQYCDTGPEKKKKKMIKWKSISIFIFIFSKVLKRVKSFTIF